MSKLVLVFSRTVDTFTMLQNRLPTWGYEVRGAIVGTNALKTLETLTMHGVLVELKGAGMMEITFLAELHKLYPLIPIVVMGDEEEKAILIRALENGASDFLFNPIDMDLLWRKCYRLFP